MIDWTPLDEAIKVEYDLYSKYVAVMSGTKKKGARISPQAVAKAQNDWHAALADKHVIAQRLGDELGLSRVEVLRRFYLEREANEK